jgi:hypothetical protein
MTEKDGILILCIVLGICGHPFWGLFLYLMLTESM